MDPRTQITTRAWQLLSAASLITASVGVWAQVPTAASAQGLKELFEVAWARQPEAQALLARRDAAQAQRQGAQAWTPEPPAFEVSHKTDRLTRNDGLRELEVGIAVPLWLPGERAGTAALADAQAVVVESRTAAARLRLAATVREAWWAWQRTAAEAEIALGQLESARRVASDVARRAKAGELARADQHQADGAVAAAEAVVAHAKATAAAARLLIQAQAGSVAEVALAASVLPEPEPEPAASSANDGGLHPALAELQDRSALADRAATLAVTQARSNPELTLTTTRDRSIASEKYGQTVTLALRLPFGGGPRHDGRVATARAEAVEAQASVALERVRLLSEREAAQARLEAARMQTAFAERRATLARETRGFFEKSFRLGESDLPSRLRIENEATEADRQAARSRIDVAAAISAWRQALGLLPQ